MDLDQLNKELAANHLAGFWTGNVTGFEQDIEPRSAIVPHVWKWPHIYDGLMKVRELVNMAMAERRTIRLSNPGGNGWASPTIHLARHDRFRTVVVYSKIALVGRSADKRPKSVH